MNKNMGNINLYYHGGSKNHGCEAIVRSTNKILNMPLNLYSKSPEEDKYYGIDKLMNIEYDNETFFSKMTLKYLISALYIKLFNSTIKNTQFKRENLIRNIKNNDICLSIGGDNYCYAGIEILGDLNTIMHKKGAKTVLWGCSINPEILKNEKVKKDLLKYNLIIVRESLTYHALKDIGIEKNVRLYPDPAFQLDMEELPLPKGFKENDTIGINISPLICNYEKSNGNAIKNYENLIRHIINTTSSQIILVSHVVKDDSNDILVIKDLYNKFKDSNRVIILEDYNCQQLKGFISKCRMFIGARTHATIAAYSTCVPTLVVGYSIKAKGIAKDIFGTYKNYVIPVQSLNNENDLIEAFEWLKNNEGYIRKHLENFMPEYCKKALDARTEIRGIM